MSALLDMVRNLAATRESKADIDAQVKAARTAWEAEHADLLASQKAYAAQLSTEEASVKALAAVVYRETESTSPAPGVAVKIFDTMAYKEEDALGWAKETKMALVPASLDVKAFEKIAKATRLPFVAYYREVRVQIATDLGKALETESEVAV